MRLQDKVAIVTGGASGFGEGIAHRFAQEGARVVVADINSDGADQVAQAIRESGGGAIACGADVASDADTKRMIEAATDAFGQLDILVQNAAIGMKPTPLVEVDEEFFDRLFRINVKSCFLGAKHAVPVLRRQGRGGVILNTVSTAALAPRPGLAPYNSTKGALLTLSRTLALELAPENIRVNGICPVAGDTAMLPDFLGDGDQDEARARFRATVPMGRLSTPADVANAALFLASDEAEFLTGVMLEVDGGRCI
ncbi:MAG: glucose 1-dehydrogenase [Alphaproteobacteria bacterium]|nr:glucose 1-dehydrogenase [Alphaproteobacteria bacterium]